MSVIKNIILFIKNIFTKQEETKTLESTKHFVMQDSEEIFVESLKMNVTKKINNKRIDFCIS